jgi:hypothetical protein
MAQRTLPNRAVTCSGDGLAIAFSQDGEKGFLLRSRIAQRLNVPKNVRLAFSLAAALQEDLFDHPA